MEKYFDRLYNDHKNNNDKRLFVQRVMFKIKIIRYN